MGFFIPHKISFLPKSEDNFYTMYCIKVVENAPIDKILLKRKTSLGVEELFVILVPVEPLLVELDYNLGYLDIGLLGGDKVGLIRSTTYWELLNYV